MLTSEEDCDGVSEPESGRAGPGPGLVEDAASVRPRTDTRAPPGPLELLQC